MKYDIILIPSLKKNWIHFDIEFQNNGKEIGRHLSKENDELGREIEYPSFRPQFSDVEEIINSNKIDLNRLKERCHSLVLNEKVENLWENIGSLRVKNPTYYCLRSNLVWQNLDEENPKYSEKLLELKVLYGFEVFSKNIVVAKCQKNRLNDYVKLNEFSEIDAKHIKEFKKIYKKASNRKITMREYRKKCLILLWDIMGDFVSNARDEMWK